MKYVLLLILFTSCFTAKKANKQFTRVALAYPEIPVAYCADRFSSRDTVIKGDTVIHSDTVVINTEGQTDTVRKNDTITITRRLPAIQITKTVIRVDTVRTENKAAVALCELNSRKVVDLLTKQTSLTDGWQKKAKTRFWIILAMGAVIGVGVYSKVSGLFKPKV